MTTTVFQLLDPQDAFLIGHLTLKSDVTSPVNGMAVNLSSGYLVTATSEVAIGVLCELDQRGVLPWALYTREDANDLTAWKGKKVGVLLKGKIRLPVANVTGTLAEGAKVEVATGGVFAVTSATVGVGTIINADVRDQYGTAVQYVDLALDFTNGAVPS